MGKGNPIIQVRIDQETLRVIEHLVSQSVNNPDQPHTVSSWIRCAIWNELKHVVRNRRSLRGLGLTVQERLENFAKSLDTANADMANS